jgi:hypothetical protein
MTFLKSRPDQGPFTISQIFELNISRSLMVIVIISLAARLVFFFGSMLWPIPNENMLPVSPLVMQGYFDFAFYLEALSQYRALDFTEILQKFVAFYQRPFQEHFGHIIAGPVFPAIIGVFDYRKGNTLPLALAFLVLDFIWSFLWLNLMASRKVATPWLTLFAIAPNPIWFMLVLSPDLIFAAIIGMFYFAYFSQRQTTTTKLIWVLFMLLALLTRPNGYSILLFVLADTVWTHFRDRKRKLPEIVALCVLAFLFALYLYPYFITEMRKTSIDTGFFDLATSKYLDGLFPQLPRIIDLLISCILLFWAKVLYFVGLRPSYGATADILVLARLLPGFVLLPGLIWSFVAAGRKHAFFMYFFCLPILLGPSQDRYNLPIFPILFMFGAIAYSHTWRRFVAKK